MITAIDTNVLLDVLIPNEKFFELSLRAIEEAASEGSLVVCDVVYAELCVQFAAQRECDAFLDSNEIRVEPLSRSARPIHNGSRDEPRRPDRRGGETARPARWQQSVVHLG